MGHKVFAGVGSNIGDASENCIYAAHLMAADRRVEFLDSSSFYTTSPVSEIEQADFINCVFSFFWQGSALNLLQFLQRTESTMGRLRIVPKGPRIIDLDILLFGETIIERKGLTVPHPELHKRKFAIVPCIEIDPGLIHPLFRRPLKDFLREIGEEQQIRITTDKAEVIRRIKESAIKAEDLSGPVNSGKKLTSEG